MKKAALVIVGVIAVLLGGLWLLQGLGIVTIAPILCVADCAPVVGGSPTWVLIGLVALAGGAFAIVRSQRLTR